MTQEADTNWTQYKKMGSFRIILKFFVISNAQPENEIMNRLF